MIISPPLTSFIKPMGIIRLIEAHVLAKYEEENIKVYISTFSNLYYTPCQVEANDKPKTGMKLMCAGKEELVVGLHVICMGADEMLQGFRVTFKIGATKADFNYCVALHPTTT